jgi:hypothetical protein
VKAIAIAAFGGPENLQLLETGAGSGGAQLYRKWQDEE